MFNKQDIIDALSKMMEESENKITDSLSSPSSPISLREYIKSTSPFTTGLGYSVTSTSPEHFLTFNDTRNNT